jgi:ribonucleoside-diphosphate reductase alpha chain
MVESGFPYERDITNNNNLVFGFPIKAPKGSIVTTDMGAIEQLELWKIYQDNWCEHKPSMTCYYTDDNFLAVAQWVWDNFDNISGISFLPYDDHVYQQAPYEEIDDAAYKELVKSMPKGFDWDFEELEDNTEAMQTLACTNGVCEL